jgi:bla regulator protein BlaR1
MTPLLSAIADHLWQSTVFACVAGLLTLLLRKNRARVRYVVWMAASFKFLIPFALLVALGSQIHLRTAAVAPQSSVYVVMDDVSQPFTASALSLPVKQVPPVRNLIPAILIAAWAVGFIGISISWLIRWSRIRRAVRAGSPLKLEIPIRVVSSSTFLEPGVFGNVRPVLFLPEGISERLTPDQLKAVIWHELCHVRYRDNLIAAIQMFVETVFWFHPMVWWMGKRMVDERERACDEEVLRMGSDPGVYAQGILKVCQFYLESPVACVSGITGSDLKKRIQRIMMSSFGRALSTRKKLLLATAGAVAMAAPLMVGALTARTQTLEEVEAAGTKRAYEVASVKPNKSGDTRVGGNGLQAGGLMTVTNVPLERLILEAYQIGSNRLAAGTEWNRLLGERFDIEAKAEGNPTQDKGPLLLQSLLADRFKLAVHHETRQQPVYALELAKAGKFGPQLKPYSEDDKCIDAKVASPPPPPGPGEAPPVLLLCGGFSISGSNAGLRSIADKVTMEMLAAHLSTFADRVVLDRTGLTGTYDVDFDFGFALHQGIDPLANSAALSTDSSGQPSMFTSLRDQLGLKLEATKGPVDVLVIDHVEEPTDNAEVPGPPPAQATPQVAAGPASERPAFEVASIKVNDSTDNIVLARTVPGRYTATGTTAKMLITFAYNREPAQVSGGPSWINTEKFDIDAKEEDSIAQQLQKLPPEQARDQVRLMVQSLLADRFGLVVSRPTKEVPIYALTVAKGGATLTPSKLPPLPDGFPAAGAIQLPRSPNPKPSDLPQGIMMVGRGRLTGNGISITQLVNGLSSQPEFSDRVMVDRAGLTGKYDISLQWMPENPRPAINPNEPAPDPDAPSLFTALEEQLGLHVESTKGPVEMLVIEQIAEPTQN